MEENYVRFWELFTGLFWYANVVVLVQRCTYQTNLVAIHHFHNLLFCFQKVTLLTLTTLKTDFHSAVILEEFNLILTRFACILKFLEYVLTLQPNHLNRVELHRNLSRLLLRHTHYYLIANSQLSKKHPNFYTTSFSKPLARSLLFSSLRSSLDDFSSLTIMLLGASLNFLDIRLPRLFQTFIAFQVL